MIDKPEKVHFFNRHFAQVSIYFSLEPPNRNFPDCVVLDNNADWKALDGPQSMPECKTGCAQDNPKWQWVRFEGNRCLCIQIIDKGTVLNAAAFFNQPLLNSNSEENFLRLDFFLLNLFV